MVNGLAAVVFDIDDTLYLERDYVRSGFGVVSRAIAPDAGAPPLSVFETLWGLFESGARGDHFDSLLREYPEAASRWSVRDLVALYRGHEPDIALLPHMEPLLDELKGRGASLAIVSDGNLASQVAKVTALGLDRWFEEICLTDAWGRDYWKPSTRAFRHVAATLGAEPPNLVYVADNPHKDFLAPLHLGWGVTRLRLPGQLHVEVNCENVPEASSVEQLSDYLLAHSGPGL